MSITPLIAYRYTLDHRFPNPDDARKAVSSDLFLPHKIASCAFLSLSRLLLFAFLSLSRLLLFALFFNPPKTISFANVASTLCIFRGSLSTILKWLKPSVKPFKLFALCDLLCSPRLARLVELVFVDRICGLRAPEPAAVLSDDSVGVGAVLFRGWCGNIERQEMCFAGLGLSAVSLSAVNLVLVLRISSAVFSVVACGAVVSSGTRGLSRLLSFAASGWSDLSFPEPALRFLPFRTTVLSESAVFVRAGSGNGATAPMASLSYPLDETSELNAPDSQPGSTSDSGGPRVKAGMSAIATESRWATTSWRRSRSCWCQRGWSSSWCLI